MIEIGRLYLKVAGRDAGQVCTVVDILDNTYVLVDGQTRRRKCNVKHLEPLDKVIEIKKNANHSEVMSALGSAGFEVVEKKSKPATTRPQRVRKSKKPQVTTIKESSTSEPSGSAEKKPAKKEIKKK